MILSIDEAKRLLSEAQFAPFTSQDWYAFAGCDSKFPLICYDHEGYLIIQDGGSFTFYTNVGLETMDEPEWKRFDINI